MSSSLYLLLSCIAIGFYPWIAIGRLIHGITLSRIELYSDEESASFFVYLKEWLWNKGYVEFY